MSEVTTETVKLPNAEIVKLIEQYKTVLTEMRVQQVEANLPTDRIDDAYQAHTMDQNMVLSQEAINAVMIFGQFCFNAAREEDSAKYSDFKEFINSIEF